MPDPKPQVRVLSYDGLVAAHAETDDDSRVEGSKVGHTLRVGGPDVLTELAAVIHFLPKPVLLSVTVDGTLIADGRAGRVCVSFYDAGCADGCCSEGWGAELMVGDMDVLPALEELHGEHHKVEFTAIGYVDPLVEVEFAHHTKLGDDDNVIPGQSRRMPLSAAVKHRYRMTSDSWRRIAAAHAKEERRIAAM